MGSTTVPFAFPYPATSDLTNVPGDFQALAEAIDNFIEAHVLRRLADLAVNRPVAAATYAGVVFFATNTHQFSYCDGSAWFDIPDASTFLTVITHANTGLHSAGTTVPTGAAVANPPGSASVEGTSSSLARRDHTHALAAFGAAGDIAALALDGAAAAGATGKFADAGHTHAMPSHQSILPPGVVQMFAGFSGNVPAGWLHCNGASVLRATYPDLFSVIGTTYGAADGTHFNLPNLQGRVPVGVNPAETEWTSIGATGGEKTHLLTTAELAAHTHTSAAHTHTQAAHSHFDSTANLLLTEGGATNIAIGDFGSGHLSNVGYAGTDARTPIINSTTPGPTGSTGSGTAHNNLQPYIALNFIIKT